MRPSRRLPAVLVLPVLSAGCASGEPASGSLPAGGVAFEPLWNGRDLAGWVKVLDSDWKVEDGILSSRQDPTGRRDGESWLLTGTDYRDFVLRVEYRITPGGNSGVFLRDPVPRAARLAAADGGTPPWEAGFEAQINGTDPSYPTGSIWEIAKAPPGLERPGEWNELVIRVEGDRVRTWVNGKPGVDARQDRSRAGAIGFQRHGGAQYRDKVIELRAVEIAVLVPPT